MVLYNRHLLAGFIFLWIIFEQHSKPKIALYIAGWNHYPAHWICPRVENEIHVLLDVPGTITDSLKIYFKDLIIVLIIVYFVIKLVFLLLFKCTSIEHKELFASQVDASV